MPKTFAAGSREQAHSEAVAGAKALGYEPAVVGEFLEAVQEDEGLTSYLFESTLKGYAGWRWSITLYQAAANQSATVSEVLMVPGESSLLAPAWVPWSERLADYKALQAELEAQAAADAAEAEDAEDSDDSEDELVEGFVEIETEDEDEAQAEDSATPDVEDGVDAEAKTRNTSPWPPRLFSRKRWIGRKKANKDD